MPPAAAIDNKHCMHVVCCLCAGVVLADLAADEAYLERLKGYMCSGEQLISLARRCIAAAAICCNVHPKNILLAATDSSSSPAAACGGLLNQHLVSSSEGGNREQDGTNAGFSPPAAQVQDTRRAELLLLDLGCDWLAPEPLLMLR